ncbi:hypothetical protein N0V83_009594 [Neocucurbitaria cava]|uniref:Glycine zipper 2TM domain-containing protein n=1 Tax=Neocucurbitaria cava TaxID=798079 RepID=A0A9W8Y1N1_9PLEO|nr:hypothetical protein N0V83_009594 [Neocucurbitaria cava]
MADYEELVELGFEGFNKVTDKYHDRAYDRLPNMKRKKKRESQDRAKAEGQSDQQQQQQRSPRQSDDNNSRPRSGPPRDSPRDRGAKEYRSDSKMYSPERGQERDSRGASERYYDNVGFNSDGPNTGATPPRDRDDYSKSRGFEVAPYQAPPMQPYQAPPMQPYQAPLMQPYQGPPPGYYDQSRGQGDRGRPGTQRRGSSWSPPRPKKHDRDSHKPRARSKSGDKQQRMIATVGGAIAGGFAGNQARKGKKYDTVATIVGAIVGGMGAREASEFWDDRKKKREEKQDDWEEDFGKDERGSERGSRRRRDDRDDRDDRRRY